MDDHKITPLDQLGYIDAVVQAPDIVASLFLVAFGLILMIFFTSPFFLVLHFLMPKPFVAKYWVEPYFQFWELNFFDTFAFGLQKTNMLCGIIGWPNLGKKRNMAEAHLDVPKWYRWFIWIWYSMFFGTGVVGIVLMVGLGCYTILFKNS